MTKDEVIKKINTKYGANAIVSVNTAEKYEVASMGSMDLDEATGIGGLPYGRIVEIIGPESVGKSTFCLELLAANPEDSALYIDNEHAFDGNYARNLGVDVDNLSFSQPDSAEQALNILIDSIESDAYKIIILDSIAALVPQKELEGEIGDSNMAVVARLMSQSMRKIVPAAAKHNVLVVFINQFRASMAMFGPTKTTTGGNAMKYAASIRIELNKKMNTVNGETTSITTTAKFIKNKCGIPFACVDIDILFGEGFDTNKELVDKCIEKKLIVKGGAWLTYGEIKVQGMDKFKAFMNDNPEIIEELKAKLKEE
jgi:recombination protein RecA